MEEDSVSSVGDDLIEPVDEVIISYYLNMMINRGKSWPNHFLRDEDAHVYSLNPWSFFDNTQNPNHFVFVKRRTEACGKTDGCESGCWRIIARDKLIKSEETGKILGFKKILKFCEKEEKKKRSDQEEGQRVCVMEEYRLVSKRKQDQVICKIRVLLQPAVRSLLAKHFSFLSTPIESRRSFMPDWDLCVPNPPKDEIVSYYLRMMLDNRNGWPSHFLQSEQVYGVEPWRIVSIHQSSLERQEGRYFLVNRTDNSGRTDGCEGGCWRILKRDRVMISSKTKTILGFKRIFKFCENERPKPVLKFWADEKYKENEFKVTWVMEEYRLVEKRKQGKVICRIRLLFPYPLYYLLLDSTRNF